MLTALQTKMINDIARSEFTVVNGAVPSCLDDVGKVWTDCIIETKADRGVWTSLLNAGLICGSGGRDGGTGFTQAGWEAYQTIAKA